MAIDWNKPVQTRDGLAIRILDLNSKVAGYPVIGCVIHPDGQEEVETWTEEGRVTTDDAYDNEWHLRNVPECVTAYYPALAGRRRLCGGVIRGVQLTLGYDSVVDAVRDFPGTEQIIECVWEDDQLRSARVVGVDGEEV